jgi:hypothetical protein
VGRHAQELRAVSQSVVAHKRTRQGHLLIRSSNHLVEKVAKRASHP